MICRLLCYPLVVAFAMAASPPSGNILITHSGHDPRTTLEVARADFASTTAHRMFDNRVGNAIESVCGSYAAIESSQWARMDTCWDDARAQVRVQLTKIPWAVSPSR